MRETFNSFNTRKTDDFQSFAIEKVYKTNHHFHCNNESITYLLSYKVYNFQYVGSTIDIFFWEEIFMNVSGEIILKEVKLSNKTTSINIFAVNTVMGYMYIAR